MKQWFLLLSLLLIFSCHKPNDYDFEVAAGKVIKNVNCDGTSGTEQWLVQFVPWGSSNKIYGITIDLDSKVYLNVVLTDFNLQAQNADTSEVYMFHFKMTNEAKTECILSSNKTVSIPSIGIERFSSTAK